MDDQFEKRVRPLLLEKCVSCHGADKQKGGLLLDTKDGWHRGGDSGPAIDSQTDLSNQAKVGANKVVVVEKWEDFSALKAHSVSPHMQAYRFNVKDYVRGVHLLVLDPAE